MQNDSGGIFNFQFGMLCLSTFLFFASFNMIVPELPNYLAQLGGEQYIGLIIALFTITAGASRPFSGKLADRIGRIPVMVFGAVVCGICSLLYPFIGSVFGFLTLRFFHGFSTGFKPTGTSAFIGDVVPVNKRGEALGIQGLFASLGMAAGPAIGGYLAQNFSLDFMFYTSSAAGFMSVIILIGMKETLSNPETFKTSLLKISRHEIIETRVLKPSFVLMLTVFSLGTVLTLIPEVSEHLGIKNKGLFFTTFTLSSLLIRFLAGRASDRYGRVIVLRFAALTLATATFLIALADSILFLLIAAAIFGIGVGTNAPTAVAWTIDRSLSAHRGKGMATMYIALEIGIGAGALISGYVYQADPTNFKYAFWICTGFCLVAFIFLLFQKTGATK